MTWWQILLLIVAGAIAGAVLVWVWLYWYLRKSFRSFW